MRVLVWLITVYGYGYVEVCRDKTWEDDWPCYGFTVPYDSSVHRYAVTLPLNAEREAWLAEHGYLDAHITPKTFSVSRVEVERITREIR